MNQFTGFAGRYQRGASVFGIIAIFSMVGVGLIFASKVVPIYIDHNLIKGVAESLLESGRAASMSQTEVRLEIGNSLRVNNISDFDINSVTSSRINNLTVINITYEKRVPLVANIDVVVSFDDNLE